MEPINARSMLDAATAPRRSQPTSRLSSAAAGCRRPRSTVANQKVARAYSPIVIAGVVRLADFVAAQPRRHRALFRLCHAARRLSAGNMSRAIFAMTVAAVICFQAADIYRGAGVPRPAPADDADDLVLGVRLPAVHRRLLLRQASAAKSRGCGLSAFFFLGLAALIAERLVLRSLVRGWARQGRLDRRTIIVGSDEQRRATGRGAESAGGFRHPRARRVRRPQRQPRARHLRRQPEARQGRRHRRIRPPHPRRSRAVRAADLGGDAHPRDAEEAVGAAGRYPPLRAHQQAALPSPLLFLSRRGADARRVRGADHRLGPGDEMAVRPHRRRPHAARWPCR